LWAEVEACYIELARGLFDTFVDLIGSSARDAQYASELAIFHMRVALD
jgi:hypothetical protein